MLLFRSSEKITRQIRMTRDIGSVPMLLFASVPLSFLNWIIMSVGKRCIPILYLGTPQVREMKRIEETRLNVYAHHPRCRMGERESQLGPRKWMVIFRDGTSQLSR